MPRFSAKKLLQERFDIRLPERQARKLCCLKCRDLLTPAGPGRWCCFRGHGRVIGTRTLRWRLFDFDGFAEPLNEEQAKSELMRRARAFARRYGINSSKIFQSMRQKVVPIESDAQ